MAVCRYMVTCPNRPECRHGGFTARDTLLPGSRRASPGVFPSIHGVSGHTETGCIPHHGHGVLGTASLQVGGGVREAWPSPGGLWEEVVGFPCVLDTTGCEGWPPLSGHLLHVSGMLTSVSSVCRTVRCCWGVLRSCVPPGRRGRTCRHARLRVLGGRPMRRTGAPWGLLKFSCTRAGRAARVFASVRTAGCRQSPSASARIRWRALFDNTPVVIGSAAGSACVAGPFARPLADPLRGRGGSGGMAVPGVALPPFLIAGGFLRSGKCGPRPGDVGRGRWGRICVRHRGLLRLASTPWVSVVRAGQVYAVPAGASGRRVVP